MVDIIRGGSMTRMCEMCGKEKKNVSLEVSRNTLVFGGFRSKMTEYRCRACEKKVLESVERMLDNAEQRYLL